MVRGRRAQKKSGGGAELGWGHRVGGGAELVCGGRQSWWRRTPAVVWKRKDRIMSLKREESAIEDEPPGLEAVGTATPHVGRTATETATGWHLAERVAT